MLVVVLMLVQVAGLLEWELEVQVEDEGLLVEEGRREHEGLGKRLQNPHGNLVNFGFFASQNKDLFYLDQILVFLGPTV